LHRHAGRLQARQADGPLAAAGRHGRVTAAGRHEHGDLGRAEQFRQPSGEAVNVRRLVELDGTSVR